MERFESVQPEYNFSRRAVEAELFALCQDQQVGIMPYQVLMGGLLTGVYERGGEPPEDSHMASLHARRARATYWNDTTFDMAERLRALSSQVGCELTQLVLAWALSKPAITSVIVGCSRPDQVVKNAEAVDISLSQDILEHLDSL